MELPPRGAYFHVLYDPSDPESAAPAAAFVTQFSPWALLAPCDDETFWDGLPPALSSQRTRLWRPGPLVARLAPKLDEWLHLAPTPLRVLDVGSGTGRNAVFLVLESSPCHCECICIDNRQVLVDKCALFAERAGAPRGSVAVVCAEAQAWLCARLALADACTSSAESLARAACEIVPAAEASAAACEGASAARMGGRGEAGAANGPTLEAEEPIDAPVASSASSDAALGPQSLPSGPRKSSRGQGRLRLGVPIAGPGDVDPRPIDVALFARFTLKPSLALAAQILATQVRQTLVAGYPGPQAEVRGECHKCQG